MGLSDHHTQDIVVIAFRTAGPIPLEARIQRLKKICLGQHDPLSTDGKNLERIWQRLQAALVRDDGIMTIRLRKGSSATETYNLREAARYLKQACLEQCNLSIDKKDLERIRRNLEGIFMEDDRDNKAITALLLYDNGPDLAGIYILKETARYLRRIRIGWLNPRSTKEHRLERIRQDLLKILRDNEATACLLFYNGPDLTGVCSLVLNAAQSTDSIIAPRIEVPVPQQAPVQSETGGE